MNRVHAIILLAILSFAFLTRVWRIEYPSEYVFDEVYHAVTAKLIAQNDPRAFEWWNPAPEPNTAVDWLHPPLAKYTQAFFMLIVGENSLGWRVSSALFGVGVIALTYQVAWTAFKKREVALVAALLATLDGLLLVQSRIAMNDIHVTFFILLTLWLYLRWRLTGFLTFAQLFLVGLSAGFAMASKWSGLFALGVVGVHELALGARHFWHQWDESTVSGWLKSVSIWSVTRAVALFILPLAIYISSYWLMFAQGKTLFCTTGVAQQGECYQEKLKLGEAVWYDGLVSHFVELHHQIWWYQTHLEATHPYQSRPWQWFLNTRPVWLYVQYPSDTQIQNIYTLGNPVLFWGGAVIIVFSLVFLLLYRGLQLKLIKLPSFKLLPLKKKELFPLQFLLLSYFLVWLPWQLSPRIMFFYHYTPAVPLLCILMAYWLMRISTWKVQLSGRELAVGKILSATFVSMVAVCFLLWYPHWTALSVPKVWADTVYFMFPSWK